MPTPPLPSRDDSPVTLPADCRIDTLALWLQREGGITYVESARAVRALVEEKCRDTYRAALSDVDANCDCDSSGLGTAFITVDEGIDAIVSRVLGAP